jgi:hypothetical protein
MLLLLAAMGCSDPEPTLPEVALPVSVPEPTLDTPEPAELGPALDMPWPEQTPCKEFHRVLVSGAYLERADGSLLETSGEQRARNVKPSDFRSGLKIRPDLDPVHITGSCSDPRERVVWSCTADNGCTLEIQRIAQAPTLPKRLQDLDRAELAATVPSGAQIKRLEPVVRAGLEHSVNMLKACQKQGCASEEVIDALAAWSGPLPTPTVLDNTPWKLVYSQGQEELHFSCQPHACTLRAIGPIQTRLDLRADAQSLYAVPGRLDYRDEGQGPRVAFSGRLVSLEE